MFTEDSRVLVVAPHLDDAELGCGGLIKKLTDMGSAVRVVQLTSFNNQQGKFNIATNKYEEYSGNTRNVENKEALTILGAGDNYITLSCDYEDDTDPGVNQFHHYLDVTPHAKLLSWIEKEIKYFNPTHIFVTAPSADQDHTKLSQVIKSSLRPQFFVGSLFEYGVGLESDWQPNVYIPLSEHEINAKLAAIDCYVTQASGSDLYPFNSKSAKKRAEYFGTFCRSNYAEAFKLIKGVF